MSYNKEEILKLPLEEKLQLAEAIWESIEEKDLPVTEEEVQMARERYEAYLKNPEQEITWETLRKRMFEKYGF